MSSRANRGPFNFHSTTVMTAAGNYVVVNESVLIVKKTVGAATGVTLPPVIAGQPGRFLYIKDGLGDAATNNITVSPDGVVATTIDGAATLVLNSNYAACLLGFDGTEWKVISSNSTNAGAASFSTVATTGQATLNSAVVTNNLTAGSLTTTGPVTEGALAGAAGSNVTLTKNLSGMADATDVALFTITIPNVLAGAAVAVTITGSLGDGDSTDSAFYMVGVSRVAGANAKAVASTKANAGATAGVSGNAAVIITVPSVTGAVGATNTFAVTARVTRSAGAATNHFVTAEVTLLNGKAGGVTIS